MSRLTLSLRKADLTSKTVTIDPSDFASAVFAKMAIEDGVGRDFSSSGRVQFFFCFAEDDAAFIFVEGAVRK